MYLVTEGPQVAREVQTIGIRICQDMRCQTDNSIN